MINQFKNHFCNLSNMPPYLLDLCKVEGLYNKTEAHNTHTFIPYFPGLLGLNILKEQRPLIVSICLSTVRWNWIKIASTFITKHFHYIMRCKLIFSFSHQVK